MRSTYNRFVCLFLFFSLIWRLFIFASRLGEDGSSPRGDGRPALKYENGPFVVFISVPLSCEPKVCRGDQWSPCLSSTGVCFSKVPRTGYGYHQRENTGSRLFTDVKPCWTGLISGWVTISIKYPVLYSLESQAGVVDINHAFHLYYNVVCGSSFSRSPPDFEGFLRALRFPPSAKIGS